MGLRDREVRAARVHRTELEETALQTQTSGDLQRGLHHPPTPPLCPSLQWTHVRTLPKGGERTTQQKQKETPRTRPSSMDKPHNEEGMRNAQRAVLPQWGKLSTRWKAALVSPSKASKPTSKDQAFSK